jgi:aryl-alcohol dehydrogenase-like predicted oxidoreductase
VGIIRRVRQVAIGDDLVVNRMGFGAMRLCGPGIWEEPADPQAARAVLKRAVELGVQLIDTADAYVLRSTSAKLPMRCIPIRTGL